MQFKIYDIISRLIPGIFFISVILAFSIQFWANDPYILKNLSVLKDYNGALSVSGVVFSYMLGYVIDGIGSWNEHRMWKIWGGRPSYILYRGIYTNIRFAEKNKKYQLLLEKCDSDKLKGKALVDLVNDDFSDIYQFAKNVSLTKARENQLHRIEQFGESFTFSRNIFWATAFSTLICLVVQIFQVHNYFGFYFILVLLFLLYVCFRRCRDKALFHAREIISVAYYALLNDVNEKQ